MLPFNWIQVEINFFDYFLAHCCYFLIFLWLVRPQLVSHQIGAIVAVINCLLINIVCMCVSACVLRNLCVIMVAGEGNPTDLWPTIESHWAIILII